MTTLLNPKAFIFGLVLLPVPTEPDFPGKLALFVLMTSAVAMAWGVAGMMTQIGSKSEQRLNGL